MLYKKAHRKKAMTKRNVLVRIGQLAALSSAAISFFNGQIDRATLAVAVVILLETALDR